ncbi:hypothetical protein, partial [Mycolicibacterium sp.]|uniref:hypothetical protein n=1 Tax=Mycolicibacterium sp. TaxID=2320850 RepID=UPI0037C6CBF1
MARIFAVAFVVGGCSGGSGNTGLSTELPSGDIRLTQAGSDQVMFESPWIRRRLGLLDFDQG